jgi:enterochelin esterase-like enzyme
MNALLDVLVITPQAMTAMVVVTTALGLATLLWWRRSRRRAALISGLATALLLQATVANAVNAHYEYLPRIADVLSVPTWPTASARIITAVGRDSGHRTAGPEASHLLRFRRGVVVHVRLAGTRSGFGAHDALVYLPPQYFTQPGRRFSVLYLIHGSPGAPVDWFRGARAADVGLAAARAGHPLLLVAPRASRHWSDDSECVDRLRERTRTYLAVDVPNDVDRLFRTVPDRAHRGIAGNSAGGFCALNLGLRYRKTFSVILDLSGFDRPTFAHGMAALYETRNGLAKRVAADSPSMYVASMSAEPQSHVWLDYGRADATPGRDARRMAALLEAAGQDVVLRQRHGGHTYGVWRPALRESVTWATALLS